MKISLKVLFKCNFFLMLYTQCTVYAIFSNALVGDVMFFACDSILTFLIILLSVFY